VGEYTDVKLSSSKREVVTGDTECGSLEEDVAGRGTQRIDIAKNRDDRDVSEDTSHGASAKRGSDGGGFGGGGGKPKKSLGERGGGGRGGGGCGGGGVKPMTDLAEDEQIRVSHTNTHTDLHQLLSACHTYTRVMS